MSRVHRSPDKTRAAVLRSVAGAVLCTVMAGCAAASSTGESCIPWEVWCVGDSVWTCLADGKTTQEVQACGPARACVEGQCGSQGAPPSPDVASPGELDTSDLDGPLPDLGGEDLGGSTDALVADAVPPDAGGPDTPEAIDWGSVKPKDIGSDPWFPAGCSIPPPLWAEMWPGEDLYDVVFGVSSLPDGRLAVPDQFNNRIRILSTTGEALAEWRWDEAPGKFGFEPVALAVGPDGVVWVNEVGPRITRFSQDGAFLSVWSTPETDVAKVEFPLGIAIESDGNVLITESLPARLYRFSPNGALLDTYDIPGIADEPDFIVLGRGARVRPDGNIVLLTYPRVLLLDPDFNVLDDFEPPDGEPPFEPQWGVTFHNGYTYVAAGDAGRLYLLDAALDLVCAWGKGKGVSADYYDGAFDVAIGVDGRIYVADAWNRRIQVYQFLAGPP